VHLSPRQPVLQTRGAYCEEPVPPSEGSLSVADAPWVNDLQLSFEDGRRQVLDYDQPSWWKRSEAKLEWLCNLCEVSEVVPEASISRFLRSTPFKPLATSQDEGSLLVTAGSSRKRYRWGSGLYQEASKGILQRRQA